MTAKPPDHAEPGDRLVDFTRRDAAGRPVGFYETFCGRPVLLVVGAGPLDLPAPPDGCAVVRLAPPSEPPTSVTGASWLSDSDGAVTRHLTGAIDGPPVALLLDPTLRVVAVARVSADDGWPPLLARLAALRWTDAPAAPVGRCAPVLTVPAVLDAALCARLMAAHDADNAESGMLRAVDGKPALVADPTAKIRRDHQLHDRALTTTVTRALARRLLPELARAFYFPVRRHEAFKIVRYDGDAGGHFSAHRDNTTPDARHRRYALTLNLNTGSYEGGDLVFPEFGPERYAPPAGGAVVFSCTLLHAVRPVTAGRRYALLSFFAADDPTGR